MEQTFLLNQLLKLDNEKIVSFHVPGHKNGTIFKRFSYKNFENSLTNIDTTEIPGTDNLHHAKGVIKKAQERASNLLGSEETFFLVNGSTSGIYSMIMASTQPGDKVIIGRNCHASVVNGIILADSIPLYLTPQIDEIQGIALDISSNELEKMLIQHPDTKAVVITYPTYHGIACNLKKIADIVHKYDKILLVDEAHGAHFGLSDHLPMSALECGADIVVQSTHKTLPSFTQSSMLHIQGNRVDREKLKFMLRLHQSSSPSYVLLSSLDMAMEIYQSHGKELMKELLENVDDFKLKLKQQEGIFLLDKESIKKEDDYSLDLTRLWISLHQLGLTGVQLEEELRKTYAIQMELSNLYGVLGVSTIANEKKDFFQLANALEQIAFKNKGKKATKQYTSFIGEIPKAILTPKEALYKEKKLVGLKEAIGMICGTTVIPYPPGIPILMPGEVINRETVQYIKTIIEAGMEIIGLQDDTNLLIEVIK